MKKYRPWLSVISLIVTILAAEVWLRWTEEIPLYPPEEFTVPMPYIEFSGEPGLISKALVNKKMGAAAGGALELNQLGLRGPLPIGVKNEGIHVFVFGGSTVFNGEPLENAIPMQLQRELTKISSQNVTVFNWGVVSFNTTQQLQLLLNHGLDYKPDIVIFYGGANDLHPLGYDPRPGYPYNFHFQEVAQKAFADARNPRLPLSFLRDIVPALNKSRLFRQFLGERLLNDELGIAALKESAGYGSPSWKEEIASSYINSLEKAIVVCRGAGIRFAAFHQPFIRHKESLHPDEQQHARLTDFFLDLLNTSYLHMGERMESLEEPNVISRDISDVFSRDSNSYFWDYVHVNNAGNRVIARRIALELAESGWLKRP